MAFAFFSKKTNLFFELALASFQRCAATRRFFCLFLLRKKKNGVPPWRNFFNSFLGGKKDFFVSPFPLPIGYS